MSYVVVSIDEDGDVRVEELGDLAMSERLAEWSEGRADPESFLASVPDPDPNYWATRTGRHDTPMRLIVKGQIVKPTPVETVTKLGFGE